MAITEERLWPTADIREETRLMLDDLMRLDKMPLPLILARAVEEYWGRRLMEEHNAAYAAVRDNPDAWSDECNERALWDATLSDALEHV
jgi:hypothetical protein